MRLKSLLVVGCAFASLLVPAAAQDAGPDKNADKNKRDKTVAKPMTDKQRRQQQEKLRKELETPYKKWLNEDVGYIITDEETKAFKRLQTDEEREQFIEQFWLRRDPTPDTEENEYKEEHYRRIAYANEHLRFRHSGLEDGPRHDLHQVRPARRDRVASLGGTYSGPSKKAAARPPPIL